MATTKVTKFSLANRAVDTSKIDADAPTENNQLLKTDADGTLEWVPYPPAVDTSGFITNANDAYPSVNKVTDIVSLTQSEYNSIGSPSSNTLYIIVG